MYDWILTTLATIPYALWIFLGVGIPYALILLPRQDWGRRIWVLCVAFAVGPALLTAWMFILGVRGGADTVPLLRFDLVASGMVIITLVGVLLAWRKAVHTTPVSRSRLPFTLDEKTLILLIVLAVFVRIIVTAFWTFTWYDSLWVYGYQSRLYVLNGFIPQDIGYYPQFLQLQYTFMQLAHGGINDHAARVVIPFLHLGSIFAVYVLGSSVFTRRVGIIAAAIWTLYPHVGEWATIGDLEIPLTFVFTATTAFFMLAWFADARHLRRRYALIAGLLFGITMWTKPTAGAFIWGVVLLALFELLRVRNFWTWYPRFEVAMLTGLACIPLGSIWYLRNIALGLPPLVFPHPNWLTLARRSGDLFSWLLLALALLIVIQVLRGGVKLRTKILLLAGLVLMLLGALPSNPLITPERLDPPASYLQIPEIALMLIGLALVGRVLWSSINSQTHKIMWMLLLAAPYFVTWFFSYSYHARLVFAITPILLLPTAVILANRFPKLRLWATVLLFVISLPAVTVTYFVFSSDADWMWQNREATDYDKYRALTPGVYLVAEQLWGWQDEMGRDPVVVAPGEQRLHFFLPEIEIITETLPTTLNELDGATHYLYGSLARWRYENDEGILPLTNQIVGSLGRTDITAQKLRFADGSFRYELYELHLQNRFIDPAETEILFLTEDEVLFGDFARHLGVNIGNAQLAGNRIFLTFLWEVIAQPEHDYLLRIDLRYAETGHIHQSWEAPIMPSEHAYYNTQLWEVGERIIDERSVLVDFSDELPRGDGYQLVANFVNRETDESVPVTINGDISEYGFPLPTNFAYGSDE